jgi:membrane glycosyltransferase
MKMRQSLTQFEAAFHEQAVEDRLRREEVKHTVTQRARVRRAERVQKHGTLRFFTLVTVIVLTAVVVTVVMFETLARVAG